MNITYLLGAGASANALPVMSQMEKRMERFWAHLASERGINPTPLETAVKQVIEEGQNHSTYDTLAKKYFHQNDRDKLKQLKAVLKAYFTYEQYWKGIFQPNPNELWQTKNSNLDKRYDSMIAAFLENELGTTKLKNFNILTWNYDLQFEITYNQYFSLSLSQSTNLLNIYPDERKSKFKPGEFSIIHMNGIAINDFFFESSLSQLYERRDFFKLLSDSFDKNIGPNIDPLYDDLTYAWERKVADSKLNEEEIKAKITEIVKKTDSLVIIGYSFPLFNREIDYQIISQLRNCDIYIQDINPDEIKQVLTSSMDIKINEEHIYSLSNTNYFHIPTAKRNKSGEYSPLD